MLMKYVLKNGRVISGRKNAEVLDCNVYIQNGRITRIANDDDFDGWDVVDLNHAYVLPGLINMHAHLFGTGRPSKVLGGGGMKDQILAAASTALGRKVLDSVVYSNMLNALNAGTTTVRGVGDFYYSDVRTRDAIKNGKLGPRLLVSGPAITCPTGHGDGTFAVVGSTPDDFRRLAQNNIDHHVDLIKICVTGGVMDAKKKGEPGVTKMTLEQTKAICDYAHEKGYIVASHTESTKGIQVALDGGVEGRPPNALLYATSNRRHLMPRDMIDNERQTAIHPGEAVEEKVSLSDRFGLWLGFHPCSQEVYLAMIEGYVRSAQMGAGLAELAPLIRHLWLLFQIRNQVFQVDD